MDSRTEKALLGVLLLGHARATDIYDALDGNDFSSEPNKHAFAAMKHVFETGGVVDLVSLKDRLAHVSRLDEVGGIPYVASLIDGVPQLNIDGFLSDMESCK